MGTEEQIDLDDQLDITIDDIEYNGYDLEHWKDYLTVKIPALPCSSHLMTSTLIELNNKYQESYNCYNDLLVFTSRAEKMFKDRSSKVVAAMIADYQSRGVKQIPPLDKLEVMALAKDKNLKQLYEAREIYSIIKDFFQNNKTKLERVIASMKDISYSINQSDKNNQENRNHGL